MTLALENITILDLSRILLLVKVSLIKK